MLNLPHLLTHLNLSDGSIDGLVASSRHLSDLNGCFADLQAYAQALRHEDPLVYSLTNVEFPEQDGALSYAIAKVMPGKIGCEYYLTKGHLHTWRAAAEVYIGLSGQGVLLMQSEDGQEFKAAPLTPFSAVYVPGFTAHRTINVGETPLTYIGIYPSQAGHDYGSIAQTNFRHALVELNGRPMLVEREEFIQQLIKR